MSRKVKQRRIRAALESKSGLVGFEIEKKDGSYEFYGTTPDAAIEMANEMIRGAIAVRTKTAPVDWESREKEPE